MKKVSKVPPFWQWKLGSAVFLSILRWNIKDSAEKKSRLMCSVVKTTVSVKCINCVCLCTRNMEFLNTVCLRSRVFVSPPDAYARVPLYTAFIFYTPVCVFMWHFITPPIYPFLSVQQKSYCIASVELYIILPPLVPRAAGWCSKQEDHSSYEVLRFRTLRFHVPTLLQSQRARL